MGTRSFITTEDEGHFRGVYCHWDGYLEHNGAILREHYRNAGKIQKLVEGGDLSSLAAEISDCIFSHGRGAKWEDVKPTYCDTLEEILEVAGRSGCEFVYVFDPGTKQWSYSERDPQFFGSDDGKGFSDFQLLTIPAIKPDC